MPVTTMARMMIAPPKIRSMVCTSCTSRCKSFTEKSRDMVFMPPSFGLTGAAGLVKSLEGLTVFGTLGEGVFVSI
jgi:hypothetical protein